MEQAALAPDMLNITKTLLGVLALDEVSFGCARGKNHALCGENGDRRAGILAAVRAEVEAPKRS